MYVNRDIFIIILNDAICHIYAVSARDDANTHRMPSRGKRPPSKN